MTSPEDEVVCRILAMRCQGYELSVVLGTDADCDDGVRIQRGNAASGHACVVIPERALRAVADALLKAARTAEKRFR